MNNIETTEKSRYLMPENSGYHIYPFMLNNLNLVGNELTVYAVIYGFSMGGQGCFFGSREYLSACTNASLPTVDRVLKSLVKKKLINKTSSITNRGITPIYSANLEKIKEAQNRRNELPKIEYNQNDKRIYQNDKGVYHFDKQYNSNIIENIVESVEETPPKNGNSEKSNTHTPNIPTLEQCQEYVNEQGYELDVERFYNHYESVGWYIKGSPVTNWKALLTNWVKNPYPNFKEKVNAENTYYDTPVYDF